jgi:uncharacterized protein (DUF433 family)
MQERPITEPKLFGVGLYTASEAGRLAGLPLARLRRWLQGHGYRVRGNIFWSPPLWQPELPRFDDTLHLGFRDLVELRVVDRFRSAGLSLQQLRKAHEIAQGMLDDARPFSTASFKTDGKRLYLEMARRTGEPHLVDLLTRQHSFHTVVAPSLRSVDFDGDAAVRWWPEPARRIVVDPRRSFGRPILAEAGIATEVLADAYLAEGSFAAAASMYGIPLRDVRAAVSFEHKLSA